MFSFPETWTYLDEDSKFLYYNNTLYSKNLSSVPTSETSAVDLVKDADAVIFLSNAGNMGSFTWGFPQKFMKELQTSISDTTH